MHSRAAMEHKIPRRGQGGDADERPEVVDPDEDHSDACVRHSHEGLGQIRGLDIGPLELKGQPSPSRTRALSSRTIMAALLARDRAVVGANESQPRRSSTWTGNLP